MLQFHAADGGNATRCRCWGDPSDLCVLCQYWERMYVWQSAVCYGTLRAVGTMTDNDEEYEPF